MYGSINVLISCCNNALLCLYISFMLHLAVSDIGVSLSPLSLEILITNCAGSS